MATTAIPAPLARVAALLRCPVCGLPLAPAPGALRCARGHAYDVARDGHVTLAPPGRRPAAGDDAAMVAARAAVLDGGHFAPLSAALADHRGAGVVLDLGAGTGHHLAAALGPDAVGIALDASPSALRRAVRAHARIAAVRADIWRLIPLGDATVDLALNVFAPRNPTEIARVLRPGGTLLVVTPAPGHLGELDALHGVGIDPRKTERLHAALAPLLTPSAERRIAWDMHVSRAEAAALVRMGPGAHHLDAPPEERLALRSEPLRVTAAVDVHAYRAAG